MLNIAQHICHVDTCERPGCSPSNGCQGHAWREVAPTYYRQQAQQLVDEAALDGLVITIEQRPLQPLAMGHHESVVGVRSARHPATPEKT